MSEDMKNPAQPETGKQAQPESTKDEQKPEQKKAAKGGETGIAMKAVKKYLNDQVPVLFDFDGFPVNRKQNMLIHREFVKAALVKLIDGLEGSINNAG